MTVGSSIVHALWLTRCVCVMTQPIGQFGRAYSCSQRYSLKPAILKFVKFVVIALLLTASNAGNPRETNSVQGPPRLGDWVGFRGSSTWPPQIVHLAVRIFADF